MENNNIKDDALNDVTGALAKMKTELRKELPLALQEKLDQAISDKQVCQLLAENGIDVEALEKKIESYGIPLKRIGLQLPDDSLSQIAGGFKEDNYGVEVKCRCGNTDKNLFSIQFWVSLFALSRTRTIFRCKNCGTYVRITPGNELEYMTPETYNEYVNQLLYKKRTLPDEL